MTTLVKSNTVTVGQVWRSLSHIHLNRRDTELLDMTRVRSHSYTSLRDVVAGSLPATSNKQWNNQLSSFHSLPNMRHVHMRNPLVEKAARVYIATATYTQHEPSNNTGLSSSFSSFLKIVRFPFLSTHRGFSSLFGSFTWFKQLAIKV
ncbi:hypothetical protein M758_2G214600 [Ceratodon purpureus]|nr:hypothetical protein M758_2G214600 [Ceratodon purpureus]